MDIFMASFFPHLFVSVYQTKWGMVTPLILQKHLRTDIGFQKIVSASKFVLFNQSKPETHYLRVYTQHSNPTLHCLIVYRNLLFIETKSTRSQ